MCVCVCVRVCVWCVVCACVCACVHAWGGGGAEWVRWWVGAWLWVLVCTKCTWSYPTALLTFSKPVSSKCIFTDNTCKIGYDIYIAIPYWSNNFLYLYYLSFHKSKSMQSTCKKWSTYQQCTLTETIKSWCNSKHSKTPKIAPTSYTSLSHTLTIRSYTYKCKSHVRHAIFKLICPVIIYRHTHFVFLYLKHFSWVICTRYILM